MKVLQSFVYQTQSACPLLLLLLLLLFNLPNLPIEDRHTLVSQLYSYLHMQIYMCVCTYDIYKNQLRHNAR